jgi:hypothetical protein
VGLSSVPGWYVGCANGNEGLHVALFGMQNRNTFGPYLAACGSGNERPWVHALAGLVDPVTCKEVFQFDASQFRNNVATKQQIKEYVKDTVEGRSAIRSGAIALPPAGGAVEDLPHVEVCTKRRQVIASCWVLIWNASISRCVWRPAYGRCAGYWVLVFYRLDVFSSRDVLVQDDNQRGGDTVVSVMLPTKRSSGNSTDFKSIDQIFVVVLKPSDRYATYSCRLPVDTMVTIRA